MPTMTKRVNVRATVAVRNTNPPIYGTYKNIIMTTGDILKCLTKRAVVEEILPDGSLVRLNFKNYYTDNGAGLDAKGEGKVIKPKQPPVIKLTPVDPEKPTADITFNAAPMSNVDEKTDTESETTTETSTTTDITETEPTVLVTEGPAEDEPPAILATEGPAEDEPPAILVTEGPAEDEVAANNSTVTSENAEKTVGETIATVENNEVADTDAKTEDAVVTATENATVTNDENVTSSNDGNVAAPEKKPTTSTKKKSTSSKKKK